MSNPESLVWRGESGTEYTYWLYPRGTNFDGKTPGNFIFAKQTSPGRFVPVYIGHSNDVNAGVSNPKKKGCIDLNGATHLHVHTSSADLFERIREVDDLVARWNPPCNEPKIS